ncbi:prolyl oligopeptidase family serine peptidase [candidate division KSB1 bacterium]|nr:prolyl oligopeptidase family serine peptidase [candidate division KSB1 bacterium]
MRIYLIAGFILFLVFFWFGAGYWSVEFVTRPNRTSVSLPEEMNVYHIENIVLTTADSLKIAGSFIRPDTLASSGTVVILLAPLRGNRTNLVQRAQFYLKYGYATLLIDLRSTGESDGEFTSFGWHEVEDLIAAVNYARHQPDIKSISLHGISAGAATICYALPRLDAIRFIVLESCYDRMVQAYLNRIEMRFKFPGIIFYPVEFFVQRKFEHNFYRMNPIEYVDQIECPTFVIAGAAEKRVRPAETQAIFQQIKSPKMLWLVDGLEHVDFFHVKPFEYERKLKQFLIEFNFIQGGS